MEPLRASVTVETPRERAFELFTEGLGTWVAEGVLVVEEALEAAGVTGD